MGLYISVLTLTGKNYPDWDFGKCTGDGEFVSLSGKLPCVRPDNWEQNEDYHTIRPIDFPAWRAAIATREWENPGRFERLMDILEAEPEYWINFSF